MAIRKASLYGVLETQSGKRTTRMNDGSPFMTALLQTEFGAVEIMLSEDGTGSVSLYDGPQVNASQLQRPTGQTVSRITFSVSDDTPRGFDTINHHLVPGGDRNIVFGDRIK